MTAVEGGNQPLPGKDWETPQLAHSPPPTHSQNCLHPSKNDTFRKLRLSAYVGMSVCLCVPVHMQTMEVGGVYVWNWPEETGTEEAGQREGRPSQAEFPADLSACTP